MFIYDTPAYAIKVSMKASGPVVLEQLNLPFVKQLFTIDSVSFATALLFTSPHLLLLLSLSYLIISICNSLLII